MADFEDSRKIEGGSAAEAPAQKSVSIHSLLKGLVKHKASDLHVKVGRPPLYRMFQRFQHEAQAAAQRN